MKKYILLSIFAEGSYSGATYEENCVLTKKIWDAIKDSFDDEFYVYELDGKHSCCKCVFWVEKLTEEDLSKEDIIKNCDGEELFLRLAETMEESGYEDASGILCGIEKEVKNQYPYTEVTVKVRKENVEKLEELVKRLQ